MKKLILGTILAIGLATPAAAGDLSSFFGIGSPAPIQSPEASYGRSHGHRHHGHHHGHHHGAFVSRTQGNPELHSLVTQVALSHGVSPSLAHAIVRIESGYRCNAHNHSASGIMQVNHATARSVGVGGSLNDCRNGLEAGMRYLRQSIAMHGNGCAAFSAYQSGLGVHRCSSYGRRVMAMMRD